MSDEKPNNVRAVIPMLICRDAAAEIQFCKDVFGAEENSRRTAPDGKVVHATLSIGQSLLMIHGEFPSLASRAPERDGSSPVVIYIQVENVDFVVQRAVAAGARVLISVKDQPWGDRVGRIIDPSGHVWNVAAPSKT